jgi:hypothetical protein
MGRVIRRARFDVPVVIAAVTRERGMDRRTVFLAAGATLAAGGLARAQGGDSPLRGPYVDLTTGEGNMIARARIDGNLDESKIKYGSGTGVVSGVRPGEAIRELFGFEIFSAARLQKQPNGSFRLLHREVVYYTDLKSGEIINVFHNPYIDETVKVVDIVNDPWDETIEAFYPAPPSYGGLIKAPTGPRRPYILKWAETPGGMLSTMQQVNLYYPAALQPEKWPRESAGPMNQVTEIYTFTVNAADMQNPAKTSVICNGTWSRVTPWLPWMLMGQAPGHILYSSLTANFDDLNMAKRNVVDYTLKHYPQMVTPPEQWSDVSLSSLEMYARQQQPAPPKP